MTAPTPRMNADDRRELVLAAATSAFAVSGYAGTSTDAVAKAAGVSQPYVVRMFGTKLDLFLGVFDRATRHILEAFTEAIEEAPFDPEDDEHWKRMGLAYTTLMVSDRDTLSVMMHGFAASGEDRIGTASRERMAEIFDLLLSTGCTDDRARDFIAEGMLLNVMLSIRSPEHATDSPTMQSMNRCAFGDALQLFPQALRPHSTPR